MKNKHHRCPRWFNGGNKKWNLMTVDEKEHAAFHFFFQIDGHPMTPEQMGAKLANWIDPNYCVRVYPYNPHR